MPSRQPFGCAQLRLAFLSLDGLSAAPSRGSSCRVTAGRSAQGSVFAESVVGAPTQVPAPVRYKLHEEQGLVRLLGGIVTFYQGLARVRCQDTPG